MKIEVNLAVPMFDYSAGDDAPEDGKVKMKDSAGKFLATMLKTATEGDALKHLCWAIELFYDRPIELDQSDFEYLLKFVKEDKRFIALIKAQIYQAISACKPTEAKPAAPAPAKSAVPSTDAFGIQEPVK